MAFELVCYLNFGYPTIADGLRDAEIYYQNGCRALQLDIPSRDPYLEHDFIQERMRICLEHEPDYQKYFDAIIEFHHQHPDVALYFMLYENTVEELGVDRIVQFCKKAGICSASYVGSNEQIRNSFEAQGVGLCCYVQFHLPEDEIAFARKSNGPVLLQAKSVGKIGHNCSSFAEGLQYLRTAGITGRIYASVGIKTPEDIVTVRRAGADGAFIGSVLMQRLDNAKQFGACLRSFVAAAEHGKEEIE